MDLSEYFKALQMHDWYYNYSDDHRAWEKGKNESHRLQAIAQEIPAYLKMYKDYADFMFKPLEEREGLERPKIEDYLN